MINPRFRTALGALLVLAAAAAPAYTAEQAGALNPATNREFSAKLLMCGQCHGSSGTPVRPAIPVIWGQREEYLIKQMHDFRSKKRDVELMTWASITLHEEETAPAMAYFSKQTWPARRATAPATARPNGMAVCEACHQLNFVGGPMAPRLAGQSYEYLVESMRRFADGERKNDEPMAQLMAGITPANREAMARYLAGL
jgi:cytochrome c553